LAGTWSNAYATTKTDRYCCIPNSIEITTSSGSYDYTAYYKYSDTMSSQCWNLFLSTSNGNMKLYRSGSSSSYQEFAYSEKPFFGTQSFNFKASNTTGTPTLNIYNSGCDFTFYTRVAPSSGGAAGLVFFIILIFIIAGCCGANKYKNRGPVIIAQNLTQQPTVVYQTTPTIYVPPTNVVVNQGFVQQQPQMIYNAPNQFPNTQVNMNYAPNQFPNNQVNVNYNGYN